MYNVVSITVISQRNHLIVSVLSPSVFPSLYSFLTLPPSLHLPYSFIFRLFSVTHSFPPTCLPLLHPETAKVYMLETYIL
jgi:hypothetical protein